MARSFLPLLFQFLSLVTLAQADSVVIQSPQQIKITPASLVVPVVLTAYGFIALSSKPLQSFDRDIRQRVWFDHPHGTVPIDNYLQYAPGAAVYLLNAVGVKGRNNFRDRTIIYGMANVMMAIPVLSLKKLVNAPRPDGSGNDGFPSGHVATAFVAAEFMRQEFQDRSVWYGVGGYTAAVLTGFFRVYNDKHWFSELLTGAGIGLLAAKASYWLFPAVDRRLHGHKPAKIIL